MGPRVEATRQCVEEGHTISPPVEEAPEPGVHFCFTCGRREGYRAGLEHWQRECPCCFSQVFADGSPLDADAVQEEVG